MKALKITFGIIITLVLIHTLHSQLVWNYAAKFEGTNSSYIAVPNTSLYNKYMNNYLLRPVTAECWIYPDNATQPEKQIILQKAAGNNPSGFALYLNQGRPSVKVNNIHVFSTITQVPSQKWTHLAVVCDNLTGNWSIYINGVLYNQQFYNLNKKQNTDSLYIGKGSESPFKGYMDEVRLWNRALTTTEISKNFRSTLATYSGFNPNYNVPKDLAPNGVYTNLMLSLTFQDDEQVGTIFSMSDWSGCGFNAKNNGVTGLDLRHRPSTTIFQNESLDITQGGYVASKDNSFNNPSASITIEFWVYITFHTNYLEFIDKKGSYYVYTIFGSSPCVRINGIDILSDNYHFEFDKWIHFAFTYNSANGEYLYYKNGVLVCGGNSLLGPLNNVPDSLYIGDSPVSSFLFGGYIDEVRISNYVKTEQEIKDFMFKSIDKSNLNNPAASNLCYSFDGYSVDNLGQGGTTMFFRHNAKFSGPAAVDNAPVSPVNRHDNSDFYQGWIMSGYIGDKIPANGFSGSITSGIQVLSQPGALINDINVYVALNHQNDQDLKIYLISPQNDTIQLYGGENQLGTNDNIITIFDDEADSSMLANRYISFGPIVKPKSKINSVVAGKDPAVTWTLLIKDVGNVADVGILYNWGLQINNGAISDNKTGQNSGAMNTPNAFSLNQNYPNPFNPSTGISFTIGKEGKAKLTVFDIQGKEIAVLVNSELKAGQYNVSFNASGLSSGIYFYMLDALGYTETKKMMLVK